MNDYVTIYASDLDPKPDPRAQAIEAIQGLFQSAGGTVDGLEGRDCRPVSDAVSDFVRASGAGIVISFKNNTLYDSG